MFKIMETPIGNLRITEEDQYLIGVELTDEDAVDCKSEILDDAERQLREYFAGTRKVFDLPLSPDGTAFQRRVWEKLCEIPYGECRSYGDLAGSIGNPKACRAVGMANHRNPILIVIPCHRVLGKDGSLTGYAAGMKMKQALLDLEGIRYKERN